MRTAPKDPNCSLPPLEHTPGCAFDANTPNESTGSCMPNCPIGGLETRNRLTKASICPGCGRREIHKMCPAWGTEVYMNAAHPDWGDNRKSAAVEVQRNEAGKPVALILQSSLTHPDAGMARLELIERLRRDERD